MSWVAWGVAAGLAWLVVAVVVSLALGRRLKQQAPAEQGFFEDWDCPEDSIYDDWPNVEHGRRP